MGLGVSVIVAGVALVGLAILGYVTYRIITQCCKSIFCWTLFWQIFGILIIMVAISIPFFLVV